MSVPIVQTTRRHIQESSIPSPCLKEPQVYSSMRFCYTNRILATADKNLSLSLYLSVCLSVCLSSVSLTVCLSVCLCMALKPLWTSSAFQFLNLYTVGRTPWTGDQPVVRQLPTHRINAHRYPCLRPRGHCDRRR
jgi:hypothetical protein